MASTPDKMQAAVLNSTGWPAPIELVEVPVPKPKEGQVLTACKPSVLVCIRSTCRSVLNTGAATGAGEAGLVLSQSSGESQCAPTSAQQALCMHVLKCVAT